MANGRNGSKNKPKDDRDGGGFMAIPWSVTDSAAYQRLSYPAKALLIEIARQFVKNNNGALLCSMRYLREHGWKSSDVVSRAKKELLLNGLIHETVRGHRPNKASWYAITWRGLDNLKGFDPEAKLTFVRSAYRNREVLKIKSLSPGTGTNDTLIAPGEGQRGAIPIPSKGAVNTATVLLSIPAYGNHLDIPSEEF